MDPEKKVLTLFSLLNMESPKVQKVSHWLSKVSIQLNKLLFNECSARFHRFRSSILRGVFVPRQLVGHVEVTGS